MPSGPSVMAARAARLCVLFAITSSDAGGAETLLRELVGRLDRSAFDRVVVSLRPCGRVAEQIASTGVPVVSLEMSEHPRPLEMVRGAFRLARLFDRHDVDVVHSSLYRANVLARLAARLARRRPTVVSAQHSLTPLGSRWSITLARLTGGLADRVVVVSGAVREEMISRERFPADRIVLIENGVDTRRFAPGDRAAAREALAVPQDAFAVAAVGRLSPEKAVADLLDAVARLVSGGVDAAVLLAGDGPLRGALEARAVALGLRRRVRFLGMVADPIPVLQAADVFAMPSREEASPMALLEAMACARPVVVTAVGGVPEIVADERSGLLVPPGRAESLAAALARLAGDADLRERLGAAARARILERFDLDRMVAEHEALYRELASVPGGNGS